jgi:hypothetical protein
VSSTRDGRPGLLGLENGGDCASLDFPRVEEEVEWDVVATR